MSIGKNIQVETRKCGKCVRKRDDGTKKKNKEIKVLCCDRGEVITFRREWEDMNGLLMTI